MPRKRQPQAHKLYHERQYPPYAPSTPEPAEHFHGGGLIPWLMLVVLAVLGAWGLAKIGGGSDSRLGVQTALSAGAESVAFQPSEAALLYDEETPEAGLSGGESSEPLHISESAQETLRALAQLDSEMDRTERLAERVGQEEAYRTFELKHEKLHEAIASRPTPWSEEDRLSFDRKTRKLQAELSKFSGELEEIASLRL